MSSIRDWYLVVLALILSYGYLSLVYVNSINWIIRDWSISVEGGLRYGSPCTHKMSGLSRALHWQQGVKQEHGRSHEGTVFSRGVVIKCANIHN
jgi:hypothetical protein